MELETKAIHEGWKPGNGEPRQLPIYESTTFKYDSSEEMGMLFDLEKDGYYPLIFDKFSNFATYDSSGKEALLFEASVNPSFPVTSIPVEATRGSSARLNVYPRFNLKFENEL